MVGMARSRSALSHLVTLKQKCHAYFSSLMLSKGLIEKAEDHMWPQLSHNVKSKIHGRDGNRGISWLLSRNVNSKYMVEMVTG